MDLNDLALQFGPWFMFVFIIVILWSMIWKGIALWKAARNKDKAWFIILLIVNTLGLLEIFYIYIFSKKIDTGIKHTNKD